MDNDPTRQIGDTRIWIDRSEIYETKIVSEGIKPLSRYDKERVKTILRKKKMTNAQGLGRGSSYVTLTEFTAEAATIHAAGNNPPGFNPRPIH